MISCRLTAVCTSDTLSPSCPQASSGGLSPGKIGVGVGVGGLCVVVGVALLLRWFRRVRQLHVVEHAVLTEHLLAAEREGIIISWIVYVASSIRIRHNTIVVPCVDCNACHKNTYI